MIVIKASGADYEFEIGFNKGGWFRNGGWYTIGHIGDVDVDSVWADMRISTFEEADAMVLEVIKDCM